MKFNSYAIVARIFPGVISAIPFFVLHFFYLKPTLGQFWSELLKIQPISDITISFAFLLILIQLNRFVSKKLFEKRLFGNGLFLPTTEYLLHLNTHFTGEYKIQIHSKIKTEFGIEIPSLHQELRNPEHSRKLITESVTLIRAKIKDGRLVGQHNAEYGLMRNLAGGSIIAFFMSLANIAIFSLFHIDKVAAFLSMILAFVYLFIILFSKSLILSFGKNYADILVQEYMSRN